VSKKLLTVLQAASVVAVLAMGTTPAFARTGSWDSIAVDDTRGQRGGDAGYGVGTANSARDADVEAMAACAKAGNTSCQVMLHYRTCGAYASSRTKYGTGTGDSEREARANALANCGNPGCQLTVSDCVGE
jgi:hypothetical protein